MKRMRPAPSSTPLGELRFATEHNNSTLTRQSKTGKATRLAKGIYVVDASLPPEDLARRHLYRIIAHYWPGAVICDRSAFDGGIGPWVFICHPEPPRASDLKLPGVQVSCRVGAGPLPGDMHLPEGLYMSGVARSLLENAAVSRRPATNRPARPAGMEAVGDTIDELASGTSPTRISGVFAQFDAIRGYFDPGVAEKVRALLAAATGTYTGGRIASERLAARAGGNPIDAARIDLFEKAVAALSRESPLVRTNLRTEAEEEWLPFFEAYFSNYIEGTRFSVEEAYSIAIENNVPAERPADAHDVMATYQIVNDRALMNEIPRDVDEFLHLLQERHAVLMAGRLDKRPGSFKVEANFAGSTAFVAPTQLAGTLRAGWEFIDQVRDPFGRAVMMMFVVSECHPFDDGNGRLTRIMVNAELVARGQQRISIPNAFRNNYLSSLAGVTIGTGIDGLVSVMNFAQLWVASVDWSDWDRCMADLTSSNAFEDPATAESSGRRLRLPQH